MHGLLITGTDTGVGKTFAACGIVRTLREQNVRVGAYKPVCSGGEVDSDGTLHWPDIDALAAALGTGVPAERICPQRFAAPLAPPAAAALEQRRVDKDLLTAGINAWQSAAEVLIIEGVGGLLCPLAEDSTVADFAERLNVPLVIVAALRLGAISHTLLTLEVARGRGLRVAGVLLNAIGPDDGSNTSSIAEITARAGVPVLGVLPYAGSVREASQESTSRDAPSPRPSPPRHTSGGRQVERGGEGESRDRGPTAGRDQDNRILHTGHSRSWEGEAPAEPQRPVDPQLAARLGRSLALPNPAHLETNVCPGRDPDRLRRPGNLSRIDWKGLSAEIALV